MLLSKLCLAIGCFCVISGILGLYRFRRDSFSRLHALAVLETAGGLMVLLGLILQAGWCALSAKLGLLMLIWLVASPTSTHALAHTLWQRGHADHDRL